MKIPKKLVRTFAVEKALVNPEDSSMEISFSSEDPYERYYGNEILSHEPGAMDMSRLNSKSAPLLFNHDLDKHIGVIEKSWIGSDKKGQVKIRFGTNPMALEKLKDVQDGILKNVSVGYMVNEMCLKKQGKGDTPSDYLVTKWMPYEVSFVTIPADNTVGVGRAMDDGEKIEIEVKNEVVEEVQQTINADTTATERALHMEVKTAVEAAQKEERERVSQIMAIGQKYSQTDIARQMIENGSSVDQMRAAILEKVGIKQTPVTEKEADIGLNPKEIKQFSFMNVLRALANPNDKGIQEMAAFEREASIAAQKHTGKAARGFLVPTEILREQRTMTVGTSTQGGNLVETDLLSGSFIELLRNKSALQGLGAKTLNGLQGNISIPRQTGAGTAYWVAEGVAPTASTQAVDQVTMAPHTVGATTDYSRKLLLQSSVDVENLVRNDLAQVLALELDRVGIYGLGSAGQPLGVKLTSGIGTKDFATTLIPTFAEVVALETAVAAANADIGTMAYLTNATIRGNMKTTPKVTAQAIYIWEDGMVNGYKAEASNQIISTDVFFGNWSDLIYGFWSGLDITLDPYALSTTGGVRIVALQDCDVAVRHAASFAWGSDLVS